MLARGAYSNLWKRGSANGHTTRTGRSVKRNIHLDIVTDEWRTSAQADEGGTSGAVATASAWS